MRFRRKKNFYEFHSRFSPYVDKYARARARVHARMYVIHGSDIYSFSQFTDISSFVVSTYCERIRDNFI